MNGAKSVLVTGGTFGIGRDITLELAERGHRVTAIGIDSAQDSSTAVGSVSAFRAEVEAAGLDVEVMAADVTRLQDVRAAVVRAIERFGAIDGLVNNAAIGPLGTILDTDEETFSAIMDVNVKGAYLCSREVVPHLAGRGGSIVNVGSGAGWGKPNMAAYSASKGAVFALSAAMAYDFFHDRIRVNTVVPGGGGIMSGMTIGRVGGDPSKVDPRPVGSAAGRPITGRDLAHTVAFLISDEAEAVSGTTIDVGCFAHQGGPIMRKDEK